MSSAQSSGRSKDGSRTIAGIGLVMVLIVILSVAATAQVISASPPETATAPRGINTPPTIAVWYGGEQYFGARGVPQRRVNILGNVSDPDGVNYLFYTVNGGPPVTCSIGPDTRRLAAAGDFNIDIPYDQLAPGSNIVHITARDGFGSEAALDVNVVNVSGSPWRRNYRVSWQGLSSLQDSAQVSDGFWAVVPGGVRMIQLGYDRAIAIGDTLWDDYEVTARMTVNRIDSTATAFGSVSGGPAIGFLMRWKGHTDQPTFFPPITQPLSGYLPYGAIGWYHWYQGFGNPGPNRWEMLGNNLTSESQNVLLPLEYGTPMYFKMRVKTIPGTGGLYSFKAWNVGEAEPGSWLLTGQESLTDPQYGSFLILAHHVDVTVGTVTVEPLGPVSTPVLSSPANGAGSVGLGLELRWNPVLRAGRYHVQVSTDPNFLTGILVDDSQVMDPIYGVNGLDGATQYYWRVRAINPDNTSNFSETWGFTTSALAPSPLAPPDGITALPTTVELSWSGVPSATGYRLQVGTDSTFASGVLVDDASLVETTRIVSGLPNGRKIFWHVRSLAGAASSAYSDTWRFTTIVGTPVLLAPGNGATGQPVDLLFRWRKATSAQSYTIQVSEDSTFPAGMMILDDPSVTDTTRLVSGLPNLTTLYWRVQAKNTEGWGEFSSVSGFKTTMPPPDQLSPPNASTGAGLSVQFIWSRLAPATSYHLQVATDSLFAKGFIKNDSTIVDTSKTVFGLSYGTKYYWRIAARNADGRGTFSATSWFITAYQLPSAVVLVAPASPAVLPSDSGRFVWRKSAPGVTRYWFEYAIDTAFVFHQIDSSLADTTTVRRQLAHNQTYYWRVRAANAGGWGPFSETRKFLVSITGIADEGGVPSAFAVEQNYPNPFNPSTRITFALPKETQAKVEVYSALGERVAVLADGPFAAGYHSVVFDARGIASGTYFYRVSTPESSVIRKMLLVK